MPKPIATPPSVIDSISTWHCTASPSGTSASVSSPMVTPGSAMSVSLSTSIEMISFRWLVLIRWHSPLFEPSLVDIDAQLARAVRNLAGRPAAL